jgi:hypothetical protein
MDAAVFATLKKVQETTDESERKELQAQSNGNLAAHFTHPGNAADLEELAFDLLNVTWQDTMSENVVNKIIEVKTVGLGDPDYVNENLRGMRAYWQGKGGQILSDIIRYERATMPKEEQVAVAQRSKGQVTILGSRQAIRKFATVGLDFGPNIQERVFLAGQIATYKGYSVVEVENFEDFAGNLVLPVDELWIVGQNAGRLTYYGATAKVQQLRLPSFWLRWETARDAGMLLYGAAKGRVGRIVLT